MKVYAGGSFWGHDESEKPLIPLKIGQEFIWEDIKGFIPAIYIGVDGVVLDLCIQVPVEKIAAFLTKWNRKERLSDLSHEEYERMEQENPFSLNPQVMLTVDGVQLRSRQSCATGWHPLDMEKESIEEEAEELMKEYQCDSKSGWQFERCAYGWNREVNCDEAALKPREMVITLREPKAPVTAGYFTTDEKTCRGREIAVCHPVSGKEYIITLKGCESMVLDQETLGRLDENIEYPMCCQVLSYHVSPGLPSDLADRELRIQDCADSDQPRMRVEGKRCRAGAVSFFVAGKSPEPGLRTVVSSPHFKPADEIEWRIVFDVERRREQSIHVVLGS